MKTRRMKCTLTQGSPATFLARVLGTDGEILDRTNITALEVQVYNSEASDDDTANYTEAYEPNDVLKASFQTDERWCDSTGYNFEASVAGSAFSEEVTYFIDFIIRDGTDNVVAKVLFEGEVIRARS